LPLAEAIGVQGVQHVDNRWVRLSQPDFFHQPANVCRDARVFFVIFDHNILAEICDKYGAGV
jgi:hypothetical protein